MMHHRQNDILNDYLFALNMYHSKNKKSTSVFLYGYTLTHKWLIKILLMETLCYFVLKTLEKSWKNDFLVKKRDP